MKHRRYTDPDNNEVNSNSIDEREREGERKMEAEREEQAERCMNHGLLIHMDLSGAQHCSYCGKFID